MTIRFFTIVCALFLLSSCVEVFRPELDDFQNLLVIDGSITNQEGPYTVKLSYSSGLEIISPEPAGGAVVRIVEEGGESALLTETTAGTYVTEVGGIQGEVGKSYKVQVEIDGQQYESEYEILREPTPINSVEAKLEYKAFADAPDVVPGYQFYVNSETADKSENYFLWSMEGTYKYQANLLIYYVFNGYIREFPDHDSLQTCYLTYRINEIYTANTDRLEVPKISEKPLHFLPADDRKLTIRYSMLTSQYSVSKETYEFWNGLEKQTANISSLYYSQPYQIRGNLKNINDPDEAVLGYFMVAGVSQKRIFVDPPENVEIFIDDCALDYRGYAWIFYTRPREWPIYITEDDQGARAIAGGGCMDCRRSGGFLEVPDFWEE